MEDLTLEDVAESPSTHQYSPCSTLLKHLVQLPFLGSPAIRCGHVTIPHKTNVNDVNFVQSWPRTAPGNPQSLSHISIRLMERTLSTGLPRWLSGKESTSNMGDTSSIPQLGRSPEEGSGNYSTILAWKIPWTEEPGRLQSMRSQRVRHDFVAKTTNNNSEYERSLDTG